MKVDFDYYEYMQQVLRNYVVNSNCSVAHKEGKKNYCVEITCKSKDWLHTSIQYDEIKEVAIQKAARKLLDILYPNYISDPSVQTTLSKYSEMYINAIYKRERNVIQQKVKMIDNDIKLETIKPEYQDLILFVYKNNKPCHCNKKRQTSISAKYKTMRGREVILNAQYCSRCNKCFINYSQFKIYQEKYGAILGNIRFVEQSKKYKGDFGNLALESVLKLYGYTVNQTDNLKDQERHKILANLVEYDILSKNDIIEYLQYFINRSKNQRKLIIAVRKWKRDLVWIQDYNLEKQKSFNIVKIEKS